MEGDCVFTEEPVAPINDKEVEVPRVGSTILCTMKL